MGNFNGLFDLSTSQEGNQLTNNDNLQEKKSSESITESEFTMK